MSCWCAQRATSMAAASRRAPKFSSDRLCALDRDSITVRLVTRPSPTTAHVRVFNGVWLNELYLSNVRATLANQTPPLAARCTTLGAHVDHMAFDGALVAAIN